MNDSTKTELQELEGRVMSKVGELSEGLSTLTSTVAANAKDSAERERRRQDRDQDRANRDEHTSGLLTTLGDQLTKLVRRDAERDVDEGSLLSRLANDRHQINKRLDLQDDNDIAQNTKLAKIQTTVDAVSGGQSTVVEAAKLVVDESWARAAAIKIREANEKERDRLLKNLDTGFKILVSFAGIAVFAWAIFVFAVKQADRPAAPVTISVPAK